MSSSNTHELMKDGAAAILNGTLAGDEITAQIDVLEKYRGKSVYGNHYYLPGLFVRKAPASKNHKLLLSFFALALSKAQGRTPEFGILISGLDGKRQRIRLSKMINQIKKETEILLSQTTEPRLFLNSHCKQCEYQRYCYQKAKEKDDLSLLSRISHREVEALNRRGIFTVTQLSHIFRPRRKHNGTESGFKPHYFPLQALAIRENKIHVYNCPPLPESEVSVFLDVESDPEDEFFYLIGMKVVSGEQKRMHQFWADSKTDEEKIFRSFLEVLRPLSNFKIFHFGSFEARFIKAMSRKFGLQNDAVVQKASESCVNALEYFYSSVYLPTYSNDLKTLAAHIGFQWRHPEASGLQSIVWRKQWAQSCNEDLKKTLIEYNADDCLALEMLTTLLQKIVSPNDLPETERIQSVDAQALKRKPTNPWGSVQFVFPEMKEINKRAYYDYQRDRVYVRDKTKTKKTAVSKVKTKRRQYNKINKTLILKCKNCPRCRSPNIKQGNQVSRLSVDLKLSGSGVKRWVVRYVSWSYTCIQCNEVFTSRRYRPPRRQRMRIKYGQGLRSWVLYQHLVNNQSFRVIDSNLRELFGVDIGAGRLHEFKTKAYHMYSKTYDQLRRELLASDVLVVDEAKMKLFDATGYAWVFSNSNLVIYIFKETREGEFLQDFLKEFKGVLVSDFYAAYDSLPSPQQKCLIHLMRDLNEDVTKSPFDEELKTITRSFTVLLRSIVETIDAHGLRKRKLSAHLPKIKAFFDEILGAEFTSELAKKYQKRFSKNEGKLFTFVQFDGVPWNSNAAEHAIKHLARLRKRGMASYTKSRIDEYMQLISIYQSCEYADVSFLRFLLSNEADWRKVASPASNS